MLAIHLIFEAQIKALVKRLHVMLSSFINMAINKYTGKILLPSFKLTFLMSLELMKDLK